MAVEINRDVFLDHLRSVGAGAKADDQVRLRRNKTLLEIESSTGKLRCRASVRPGKITGKLDCLVPYAALLRLLKAAGTKISLEKTGDELVIESGRRKLKLLCTSAHDWVGAPEAQELELLAEIPGEDLWQALPLAAKCASTDSGRPVISTVAFASQDLELLLVATDSYRLAALPLGVSPERALSRPLLLPLEAAKLLAQDLRRVKAEEVEIRTFDTGSAPGIYFAYGDIEWFGACVEGRYPDWQELLPEGGDELLVDRAELSEALRGVSAIGGGRRKLEGQSGIQAARLQLGQEVRLVFHRPGIGTLEEDLPEAKWHGQKIEVGLNPIFLDDMLSVLSQGSRLRAEIMDETRGILWHDESSRTYLAMPVKLPGDLL